MIDNIRKRMGKLVFCCAVLALMLLCVSCSDVDTSWLWARNETQGLDSNDMIIQVSGTAPLATPLQTDDVMVSTDVPTEPSTPSGTDSTTIPDTDAPTEPETEPETELETEPEMVFPVGTDVPYTGEAHTGTDIRYTGSGQNRDKIVVIDAGHQSRGNSEKEPIGPGADVTQSKVSSGTEGSFSHTEEYVLNLRVAMALRDELIARGYSVVMIRETHDVDISNMERAQIANECHADAFIRIHANGWDTNDMQGAMTVCQSAENPYPDCRAHYAESRRLSEAVLDAYCKASGIGSLSIWETDTKAGTNWSQVPTTILELGFMTNEEDDLRMAEESFATDAARGIANGLDAYFSGS